MCSSSSTSSSAEERNHPSLCEQRPSTSSGSSSPQDPVYPLIPRNQLQVQEQLGAGTYGSVFKGIWDRPDGRSLPVALKKVFMLEKEVDILSQIRHRNIIQFYGVSQANPDFFIVTEYAENGSLYEHLHNKEEQISLERTIKWAQQVAKGVAYLHYEAPITVIHRDLKSKNIVIGKKFQCKLCDFGTSKDLTHSWTAPSWGGTAAWMSPEIISQREGITTATDVWSFAVVLWEMFSRQVPYKGLTEFKIYSIISQHGVRLVIPDTCPEPLAELLRSCWSQNPKERPDMRYVLASLERMSQDKGLREECAQFLDHSKEEWHHSIQEQLVQLDALKLDLARQMEDLARREQALRKRESSHRNFLHMVDIMNVENVCEWNEDCVCEWVQNVAAGAVTDFPDETVDKIISCVLQYGINGPRLMKITEKDLDSLGIEPVALRRYITLKLDELRERINVQLCNFPCGPESPDSCCPASAHSTDQPPIECQIVLHVGLYSRMLLPGPAHRFKVFLDSDWEMPANGNGNEPPEELQDSATVIKEVNISMTAADGSTLLDPVKCICPPFGYLEWAQLSREQQQRMLPLTLKLSVIYTDQVIQPQNTRIQIQLDDLAGGPRTLCCKRVPLKLYAQPTDSSLSRISSSLQRNSLKSPPANFRARRLSLGMSAGSISPDRTGPNGFGSNTNLLNRSPIWADLAASIRNSTFPAIRPVSKSISTDQEAAIQRSASNEEGGQRKQLDSSPLQMARQKALAKVRRQRAAAVVQRKKCLSETETDNRQNLPETTAANQQQQHPKFFMSSPIPSNSSPSSSSSPSTSGGPSNSHSPTSSSMDQPNVPQKEEENKMSVGPPRSSWPKQKTGGGLSLLLPDKHKPMMPKKGEAQMMMGKKDDGSMKIQAPTTVPDPVMRRRLM